MRDRRDARKRLAPESQRRNPLEVVGTLDLARGMPLDRKPRVLRLHPLAVVLDPDQLLATEFDGDGNTPRAGVDGILDQFLDHRRRALDDLAGRNLVRKVGGEAMNPRHSLSIRDL